jgi:hypothetical protein
MKNKILKYSLVLFFWMVSLVYVRADFPLSPGSDENEDEQLEETPIDNWQLVLMLAAITIGIYFLAKYRKKMEV